MIAAATDNVHAAIAARAPDGVEVRFARPGELDGVEFAVVHDGAVLDQLPELRALRAVQTLSAGTDWIEGFVPPWAALCNARGARDVPVAEWVVGALLGAQTGLLAGARRSRWEYEPQAELHGSTVLILGYGSIGRAVERRLAPFGVTVVGVGRTRLEELGELLPAADAVVVLAPLTHATRGMVGAGVLARMRDGALLVNAGRGPVVDTDALVAAVRAGRIRAALDVTDPEPLPPDHELWTLDGVFITPHNAGDTPGAEAAAEALARAQMLRYRAGLPLEHVVRPGAAGA